MSQDNFTLGSSDKVVQFSQQEVLEADRKLNKLLIQSVTYSTFGLVGGVALSLFFKKKIPVVGYTTGFGLGLAIHKNAHGLIQHVFTK